MAPADGLPEHPELRRAAQVLEESGLSGEVTDEKWRIVFISSEEAEILGIDPAGRERFYGISPLVRHERFFDEWGNDPEPGRRWWEAMAPIMLHDVPPDDPDFEEIFGSLADVAREISPTKPPATMTIAQTFSRVEGLRSTWLGASRFVYIRLHELDGRFVGTLLYSGPEMPHSLTSRLARGDIEMYRRMDRLREPERRTAAILFADLEGSGVLSRKLSSRSYFELIRSLTDLIDDRVSAHEGITGKHAGDGASALFLAEPTPGGEATAARSAVEAAREIREGARGLAGPGTEVSVKIGVHWGSTLTVGQVSTRGRLEVTALGDEMNEAARIESAARGGLVLASKDLVERLSPGDALELSIEPDELTYRTLAELSPDQKALRDAGQIAVVEL